MLDITDLTIKKAYELLTSKQIKARELITLFLDRAKKLNGKLNADVKFSAVQKDTAPKNTAQKKTRLRTASCGSRAQKTGIREDL